MHLALRRTPLPAPALGDRDISGRVEVELRQAEQTLSVSSEFPVAVPEVKHRSFNEPNTALDRLEEGLRPGPIVRNLSMIPPPMAGRPFKVANGRSHEGAISTSQDTPVVESDSVQHVASGRPGET